MPSLEHKTPESQDWAFSLTTWASAAYHTSRKIPQSTLTTQSDTNNSYHLLNIPHVLGTTLQP